MLRSDPDPTAPAATSRRTAVAAALGFGVAVATRRPGAASQGTPGAAGLPQVVRRWVEAYNARDAATMASLYAAHGIFEDVPNGFVARGPEIPGFLEMGERGLADVRLDLRSALHGERWAVIEYEFHATNAGTIPGAEPGASFVSRAVTVFEFDGDEIVRSSDYYDMASIMAQLGLLPQVAPAPPAE
jgi:steroid delta-isomerase-like uncharacterized protein